MSGAPAQAVPRAGDAGGSPTAVLAWLSLPPGCAEFWNAVADELARRGARFAAVVEHASEGELDRLGVPHIAGPFATTTLAWRERGPALSGDQVAGIPAETVRACALRDRCYWPDDPRSPLAESAAGGVGVIDGVVGEASAALFGSDAPMLSLGVVWNGNNSGGFAARWAMERRGVPCVFAERGPIPPSVFVDPRGVNGQASLVVDDEQRSVLRSPPTDAETAHGRMIAEALRTRRAANWSSSGGRVTATRGVAADVVFFGSVEPHLVYADLDTCTHEGMPWGDSYRACEALLHVCRGVVDSARVVVKPHPHDPLPERYGWMTRSLGGRLDPRVEVFDAVSAGCVVATTSESVAWSAALCGAKVLSLSRTPLGVAGGVIEPGGGVDRLGAAIEGLMAAGPAVLAERHSRACGCAARLGSRWATTDEGWRSLGLSGPEIIAERLMSMACAPNVGAGLLSPTPR